MAIIKIVSTRRSDASNLTFGKGSLNALTVTGEVYDAEDYKVLFIDPDTNLPQKVDLSSSLLKTTTTVSFRGNEKVYSEIQDRVAAYFSNLTEQGIFQIKVGLVIKSNSVSKPIDGIHPTLGIPTKKVLVNNAELIEVEEPELLEMAEDILEATTEARENTKEVGKVSLAAFLSNKAKEAGAKVGNAIFTPSKKKVSK